MYRLNHDILDSNDKLSSYEELITEEELKKLIHNLSIKAKSISGAGSSINYQMEIANFRTEESETQIVSGFLSWEKI
jgi:uncharacterized protein YfcZ (UPF0381/DUF406 family)